MYNNRVLTHSFHKPYDQSIKKDKSLELFSELGLGPSIIKHKFIHPELHKKNGNMLLNQETTRSTHLQEHIITFYLASLIAAIRHHKITKEPKSTLNNKMFTMCNWEEIFIKLLIHKSQDNFLIFVPCLNNFLSSKW